jgi:hypothetical protein
MRLPAGGSEEGNSQSAGSRWYPAFPSTLVAGCSLPHPAGGRETCGHRWTRGEAPRLSRSTSSSLAIEVSPGVVIASAPCATP